MLTGEKREKVVSLREFANQFSGETKALLLWAANEVERLDGIIERRNAPKVKTCYKGY